VTSGIDEPAGAGTGFDPAPSRGASSGDLAELAISATTANIAFQSALQTTASVRQLSLREFLR
jgi:hypothetical protein